MDSRGRKRGNPSCRSSAARRGQLRLIDLWYPLEGEREQRRKVLERTLTTFPEDESAVFNTNLQLAYLAYHHEDFARALEIYGKLAEAKSAKLDPEDVALARYMNGLTLAELDRTEEAYELVAKIVGDEELSAFRRGWAATMAGKWAPDGEKAIAHYREALKLGGQSRREALAGLVVQLLRVQQLEEAATVVLEHLATWEAGAADDIEAILATADEDLEVLRRVPGMLKVATGPAGG